jgi:tetratricopeptide (TPR) repeat protein
MDADAATGATSLDVRAKAARAAGVFAHALSLYNRSDEHYHSALALAFQLEEDEQIAATYVDLGILRKDQGRFDEALSYFDQSVVYQSERSLKFPWQSKADTLLRFDQAEGLYRQAMALNQRIGDEEGLAHTLRGLGEIAWRRGDAELAEGLLRQNEEICRRLNHTRGLSWTSQQLGNIARVRSDWRTAAQHYADALTQLERMGDRWGLCEVLAECGHLAVAMGRYALAARWLSIAEEGFRELDAKLTAYEHALISSSRDQCERQLGAEALHSTSLDAIANWHAEGVAPVVETLRTAHVTSPQP